MQLKTDVEVTQLKKLFSDLALSQLRKSAIWYHMILTL